LAADPAILLMDEPFGALDPLTRTEMQEMLKKLLGEMTGSEQKTVLMVTHDLDEALFLADRIVLLGEGKLIVELTPEEFTKSERPEVRSYIRAFHRGEKSTAANEAESQ
jgi:osmoprotectant transport system ATP-binding protein